jgi:hypothetical protein
MNFLQILFKKIEECQKYAQELDGFSSAGGKVGNCLERT